MSQADQRQAKLALPEKDHVKLHKISNIAHANIRN